MSIEEKPFPLAKRTCVARLPQLGNAITDPDGPPFRAAPAVPLEEILGEVWGELEKGTNEAGALDSRGATVRRHIFIYSTFLKWTVPRLAVATRTRSRTGPAPFALSQLCLWPLNFPTHAVSRNIELPCIH